LHQFSYTSLRDDYPEGSHLQGNASEPSTYYISTFMSIINIGSDISRAALPTHKVRDTLEKSDIALVVVEIAEYIYKSDLAP